MRPAAAVPGYLVLAAASMVAGWVAAVAAGVDGGAAAFALAGAWAVQAAAFGLLARRLYRGLDATRAWAVGIGARVAAVFAAWLAMRLEAVGAAGAAVFGLGLVALMILEAIWLATIPTDRGSNVT